MRSKQGCINIVPEKYPAGSGNQDSSMTVKEVMCNVCNLCMLGRSVGSRLLSRPALVPNGEQDTIICMATVFSSLVCYPLPRPILANSSRSREVTYVNAKSCTTTQTLVHFGHPRYGLAAYVIPLHDCHRSRLSGPEAQLRVCKPWLI